MTEANRKTNLGVLVVMAATLAFGVVASIVSAWMAEDGVTTGEVFRFGVAVGIAVAGAIALGTMAVLVLIKKPEEA